MVSMPLSLEPPFNTGSRSHSTGSGVSNQRSSLWLLEALLDRVLLLEWLEYGASPCQDNPTCGSLENSPPAFNHVPITARLSLALYSTQSHLPGDLPNKGKCFQPSPYWDSPWEGQEVLNHTPLRDCRRLRQGWDPFGRP